MQKPDPANYEWGEYLLPSNSEANSLGVRAPLELAHVKELQRYRMTYNFARYCQIFLDFAKYCQNCNIEKNLDFLI